MEFITFIIWITKGRSSVNLNTIRSYTVQKMIYSRPLNNTGLNCMGPLIPGVFPINPNCSTTWFSWLDAQMVSCGYGGQIIKLDPDLQTHRGQHVYFLHRLEINCTFNADLNTVSWECYTINSRLTVKSKRGIL